MGCANINLWGSGLAKSSGSYTVDGWPPTGSGELAYGPETWRYDRTGGGPQLISVISVAQLIAEAVANGDRSRPNLGFHFKIQSVQSPQYNKTFWVDCPLPAAPPTAWAQNVGQPPSPAHATDPQMGCSNINLYGNGLANSSGTYTIDGWPPTGGRKQAYASSWHYDTTTGGTQVISVISVTKLIAQAVANGDRPQRNLGFHFRIQSVQAPQENKTFWVDCPSLATPPSPGKPPTRKPPSSKPPTQPENKHHKGHRHNAPPPLPPPPAVTG